VKKNLLYQISYGLIALALVASLFLVGQRMALEQSSRQSEIVLDWAQVTELAKREKVSTEQLLDEFSPYITGILFKEPTIADLQKQGRALLFDGQQLLVEILLGTENASGLTAAQVNPQFSYLVFSRRDDMLGVLNNLLFKEPGASYETLSTPDGRHIIATSLQECDFEFLGLGFDDMALELVASRGLRIAVQLRDFAQPNRDSIQAVLAHLEKYPLIGVGFNGAEVPGVRLAPGEWQRVKEIWQEEINALGVPVIMFEFFHQDGLQSLAAGIGRLAIIAFTITEAEMLNPVVAGHAPQRFQLATAERGVTLAFVRLPMQRQLTDCADFLAEVRQAIEEKGTAVGPLIEYAPLHPSEILLLLVALGVCAGGWLLAARFSLGRWAWPLAIAVFFIAAALLLAGRVSLMQKVFALAAALIFPTLSLIHFMPREPLRLGPALLRLFLTVAVSLIGAVFLAGLLADSFFMVKIDQFTGVKAAHLIPPLLVATFFFFFADKNKTPLLKLKGALDYKPDIKALLLGSLVIAVMFYYLLRTGNENNAVLQAELHMRDILDKILYVRPRNKEFLFGYPFLLLIYSYGYRDIFLPFLIFAVIGQVSLVNTFAHIHTPVLISLLRTVNGLWAGIVIGLLLLAAALFLTKLWRRRFLTPSITGNGEET